MPPGRFLNVNVVPDERMLLDIGHSRKYRLLDGQIRSIHVGRSHRIPVDALSEFVNRQQATPFALGTGATRSRRAWGEA